MKTVFFDRDIPRILATKAAAGRAKKLLSTGLNAVKYETGLPEPALPADDWVRVRNIACGLCGTDISFYKATTGLTSALEPIPGTQRTFLGSNSNCFAIISYYCIFNIFKSGIFIFIIC